jgi:hypothetical protein
MADGADAAGARCLAHVQALAAPEMGGRLAGSPGEARTVEYLTAQLRAISGLTALQVEPLRATVPVLDAMPSLRVVSSGPPRALALLKDFGVCVQGAASGGTCQADAVWAGAADPDGRWPELRGRALVCWGEAARPLPVAQAFTRYLTQLRCARDAGAAAVLRVVDDVACRKVMLHHREEPGLPVLEITSRVARELLPGFPLLAEGTPGARVELDLPLRVDEVSCAGNVVARCGQGPPRLILCAHHDGVGALPDGRCFAGAQDNASGVAVLLELVRALAAGADGDDAVVAVFTAAEEPGMFGAETLLQAHPDWWSRQPVALVVDELAGGVGEPLHLLASHGLRQRLEPDLGALAARVRRAPLPDLAFADHLPLLRHGLTHVGIATAPDRRALVAHRLTDTPDRLSATRLGELWSVLRDLVATARRLSALC